MPRSLAIFLAFLPASFSATVSSAAPASLTATLSPSPTSSPTAAPPSPLEDWGRVPLPPGLAAGVAPDAEVVTFLIKVNNLLIEEPEALDENPGAAEAVLALLPRYEKELGAKKVRVQALRRLIQGGPGVGVPKAEVRVVPTSTPDPERERTRSALARLEEKVSALEARLGAQDEAEAKQKALDASLLREQADLAARQKALEEGLSRSRTQHEDAVHRLAALELRQSTLDAGLQKHALDASAAREAAEAGKTGMASQLALTERLSMDLEKTAGQVRLLEQEKQNLRRDLVAIQELLKVGQAGSADLREDVQYLRDQFEKRSRQEESARKEKAPGILKHPAVPGAAFVIAIVALVVAL